jgi:hypothetical protein
MAAEAGASGRCTVRGAVYTVHEEPEDWRARHRWDCRCGNEEFAVVSDVD